MKKNIVPKSLEGIYKKLSGAAKAHPGKKTCNSRKPFTKVLRNTFPSCGQGCYRETFVTKDTKGKKVVIKVINAYPDIDANDSQLINSNKVEFETYQLIQKKYPDLAKLLLPPLSFWSIAGHDIIVFPHVEIENDVGYSRWDEECENPRFKEAYELINDCFIDTHEENIGIYNGLPVLIDFGNESGLESIPKKYVKKVKTLFKKVSETPKRLRAANLFDV